MNYKQIIDDTVVPAILSYEEKNEKYKSLIQYVNRLLPCKLYRFRTCKERNLDAFYKDELWFSNGSSMNDDFDARLYYDKKKIKNWLDSFISEEGTLKIIDKILDMKEIPEVFGKYVPNGNCLFNELKMMPRNQINRCLNEIISTISEDLEKELNLITERVQSMTKFACFTEKLSSDMMWGNYANNATGFALEYDFGKQNSVIYKCGDNGNDRIWTHLFPIIYGNQKMDTTAYVMYLFQMRILMRIAQERGIPYVNHFSNSILPCPDEFMATKLAIKKSNDWRQEKEWRMFFTTNNVNYLNEKYSCVIYKPSAVFLGRKISSINQKIIMHIASEKNIPVYKMGFNKNSKTYSLRKYKL